MGNSPVLKMDGGVDEPTREFSLANKKLKLDTAADVEEYVSVISKIANLTVVSFNGNTIGVDAAKSLAESVKSQKSIREVHLNDCFTGRLKEEVPVAIEAFCKVFMNLPNLVKVDFSDNAFGPVGAKAVYEYLSNASCLQELRLNNNGLGPEGGKLIGEALLNCQQNNKVAGRQSNLRKVSIGRNRLENGSADSLGKAFEAHENLEEISLYQNGIRPEGIIILSKSFAKCRSLTYIDLQDNTFTEKGAQEFAQSLSALTRLSHLNLGDCLLGEDGSILILKAIFAGDKQTASSLKHLNLQYNEMDDKGARIIADNAASLVNLKQIFLNGNNFKSEGPAAKAIKTAFELAQLTSALDEWDDMEADLDSDEEESSSDQEDEGEAIAQAESEQTSSTSKIEDQLTESIEALKIN